jgi:hypothetical protein
MVERKYLAHFLSTDFDVTKTPGTGASGDGQTYVRIGSYLEAYQEELNPQVDVRQNILGEQYAVHNGYQVSSTAEPFYIDVKSGGRDKALSDKLQDIANGRKTGDECKTYRVEALFSVKTEGSTTTITSDWAYREECLVVPQSVGGDTSGVQIPFQVLNVGNRKAGSMTWTMDVGGVFTLAN